MAGTSGWGADFPAAGLFDADLPGADFQLGTGLPCCAAGFGADPERPSLAFALAARPCQPGGLRVSVTGSSLAAAAPGLRRPSWMCCFHGLMPGCFLLMS